MHMDYNGVVDLDTKEPKEPGKPVPSDTLTVKEEEKAYAQILRKLKSTVRVDMNAEIVAMRREAVKITFGQSKGEAKELKEAILVALLTTQTVVRAPTTVLHLRMWIVNAVMKNC
ncbi:hypothetical protein J6590_025208 [Homalodisca vitripennis]|nr:hypothetical protein J6590_025208 [Homalodisca vitripennis]